MISGLNAQTKSPSQSFSFEDAGVTLPSPNSVSMDVSGRLGERFYGNIDFLHERYDNYGEMMINAFFERKYAPGGFLELVWEREYGGKWLDAAAIYLNTFNNSCYRVKMANIAQTVNVLQAMVLTNDTELIKTPTFYVFKMYKPHFDAIMLPVEVHAEKYGDAENDFPTLSVSASKNDKDEINITIANVTYDRDLSTIIDLNGIDNYSVKKSEIITAEEMNSYNDFEKEEEVNINEFKGIKKEGNSIKVNIPSKSVILISLN